MKDVMGMMKKVGEMQARLKEVQEELARAEVEGKSGAGSSPSRSTARAK
jgi:DNA-binding protein YbaB